MNNKTCSCCSYEKIFHAKPMKLVQKCCCELVVRLLMLLFFRASLLHFIVCLLGLTLMSFVIRGSVANGFFMTWTFATHKRFEPEWTGYNNGLRCTLPSFMTCICYRCTTFVFKYFNIKSNRLRLITSLYGFNGKNAHFFSLKTTLFLLPK